VTFGPPGRRTDWGFGLGRTEPQFPPTFGTRPIAFGEIKGEYEYNAKAEPLYRHSRKVKWLNAEVPRSVFDQDILYSFGAFLSRPRVELDTRLLPIG